MIGGDVGGVCDEIPHWRAEDTRDWIELTSRTTYIKLVNKTWRSWDRIIKEKDKLWTEAKHLHLCLCSAKSSRELWWKFTDVEVYICIELLSDFK